MLHCDLELKLLAICDFELRFLSPKPLLPDNPYPLCTFTPLIKGGEGEKHCKTNSFRRSTRLIKGVNLHPLKQGVWVARVSAGFKLSLILEHPKSFENYGKHPEKQEITKGKNLEDCRSPE